MAFLISINGQLSPFVSSAKPVTNYVHSVSNLSQVEQSSEFKKILGENEHRSDQASLPVQRKISAYKDSNRKFDETRKRFYVRDIMSTPVNMIQADSAAEMAKETLNKYGYRHLPVVNSEKMIIGMISDRELNGPLENRTCREIMNKKVIMANDHVSLNEVAIIFLQEKINALPIVNSNNVLVGIVTQSDILKYVVETTAFLGKG